jgi:hypothetical protein
MAKGLMNRIARMGASIEAAKGTAETVSTAAASTLVTNATCEPVDLASQERAQAGSFGEFERVPGRRMGRMTFTLRPSHADILLTLLQGAGLKLTTLTLDPAPDEDDQKTLTLSLWEDGRKKQIHGAVCEACRFYTDDTGGEIMCDMTFVGIWDAPVDAAVPGTAFPTVAGYVPRQMTLTRGGAAIPPVPGFELDLNPEATLREDVTQPSGYAHGIVTNLAPTLTLNQTAQLVAAYDGYGKLLAGTAEALSMVLSDLSSPANTLTITSPKSQIIETSSGDRDGTRTDDVVVALMSSSAGNDMIQIVKAAGV